MKMNFLKVWIQLKHVQYLNTRVILDKEGAYEIGFIVP